MVMPGEYCGERAARGRGSAPANAGTRPPGDRGKPGEGGKEGKVPRRPPTWPAAVTVLLWPRGRPAGVCPPGPSGLPRPRVGSRRRRLRFRSETDAGRSRRPPSRCRRAGSPGRCSGRPRRQGSSGGGAGQRMGPLFQVTCPHPPSVHNLTFGSPSISPEPAGRQEAQMLVRSSGTGYPRGSRSGSRSLGTMDGAGVALRSHLRAWGQGSLRATPPVALRSGH